MNKFDVVQVGSMMSQAFLGSLGNSLPIIAAYARTEFEHFAAWMRMLAEHTSSGAVSQEQAKLLLHMQTLATRNVFLTIEGLGLLAVERAINAAMESVRGVVNALVGFPLL